MADSGALHTIDYQRLNELYDGDNEQVASLFELFLDEVFPDFDEIEGQIQQQKWPDVAATIHKMVPWVGMVGLTALEAKLRTIETLAKTQTDTDQIMPNWNQFKVGLNQSIPVIQQELVKLTS